VKPPKTFEVGNRLYSLVLESNPDSPEGQKVWGYLEPTELQLVLDADMQPGHMAEILVHELLHAIFNDYPLNVRPLGPSDVEEFYAGVGARGLVKLFNRNLRLYSWWRYLMSA